MQKNYLQYTPAKKNVFYHIVLKPRFLLPLLLSTALTWSEGLPLFYWQTSRFINFGDYLSLEIVERMVHEPIRIVKHNKPSNPKKLLAVGSILRFARDGDVIWGSGVSGRSVHHAIFHFSDLDVRAVRGPLTRQFLQEKGISCPEVYGDPALLMPVLFPELKKSEDPEYDYIVIPHYSENDLFPQDGHVVYPTEPWLDVVQKILSAKFVISSSLHGLVVAEAYGIPARLLRVTENEHIFKYQDYYFGTGRNQFRYASSVEEALLMGGEKPYVCDLQKLYEAFPFEFWNHH